MCLLTDISTDISNSGMFGIKLGDIEVKECFPGIDGKPLKTISINVVKDSNTTKIMYYLENGVVTLTITQEGEYLLIDTSLTGLEPKPHWFYPVFTGEVLGIKGTYRQGFGFGGPSGFVDLLTPENKKNSINSFGSIALEGNSSYTHIYCDKHDRFINQYTLKFDKIQDTHCFTSAIEDTYTSLSMGFRLEQVETEEIRLPTIIVFTRGDLKEGLNEVARHNAKTMSARNCNQPTYHWCSWYYLYYNFSQEQLKSYLESFSTMDPTLQLKYIQIDAGYFPSAGDWLMTNTRWPEGLRIAFDEIKKYNYKPAIWIAPFMVGNRSQLYREHPDWILYQIDTTPMTIWKFYGEEHVWGLMDEEYYVLDTSHPDAMAYIERVFRTLREWGAELFKTDFMLWGIQDSTKVKRYAPGKTSIEYFRDLLEVIRRAIGEESYWLGCIAPFLPFIGYADGMRIAGDVGSQWNNSMFGPENMIQEIVGDNYFNNIYWQNDPDAMMLRNFHTYLTAIEIEALVLLQAVSGGAVYTSDPLHLISNERVKLFSFVKPCNKVYPLIPYLGKKRNELVIVNKLEDQGRYNIFLFNPTQEEITGYFHVKDLIGEESAYLKVWNTNEHSENMQSSIIATIPAHGCRLYFASAKEVLDWEIPNLWVWEPLTMY